MRNISLNEKETTMKEAAPKTEAYRKATSLLREECGAGRQATPPWLAPDGTEVNGGVGA